MTRLAVDPAVLAGAGVGLIGVGEGLGPAVAALSAAYNANTGQDTAGVMFGRHYADAGRGIMKSVAAGINALLRTGYGVQVSAVNYSRAEAHSDLSRRAQPLETPPCPANVAAAGGPSPLGGRVGEPALWAVVELLVGDLWPSGSPTQMRLAAGAWRAFASALHGISFAVSAPYNTVAAQEIPEAESIKSVIRDIDEAFGTIARGCEELATALEGFATGVENTQNAIRRLLSRLGSIGSIVGIFFEFVRGHGEEDLEQIAADIRTVMGHLKNEADAHKAMIEQALRDFEALNQAMQVVADREFKEFFGEDVGNVLSQVWRAGGDIDRGLARWTASTVEGLEALDPTRVFYDPNGALQTWKGLAQMAQVVTNPTADPELTKEIVKGLARVDEWKTQRPLTALTENLLDVGTLILGPEAASGGAAKADRLGADVAEHAPPVTGALGKLGEVTRPLGALDEITTHTGQLTKELDSTALAPAGGKPVSGPVIDKPAGTPVLDKPGSVTMGDKPAAVPVADGKPVGGKPVSPDVPSGLLASPVESQTRQALLESVNGTATKPGEIGAPQGTTDNSGFHSQHVNDFVSDVDHGYHAWHHEGGISLDPVQNFEADKLLDRARLAEPHITDSMRDISSKLETGKLVGEEFRLKAENSLKEKLAASIFDHPDRSLAKHLADIKDSVRYTIQTAGTSYAHDVQQVVQELASQGYGCTKFKNFWGSEGYQGINSFWVDSRSGQVFELQFHTPESFSAKMLTHGLYEEERLPATTPLRKAELESMQQEIFGNVPLPKGASSLKIPERVEPK